MNWSDFIPDLPLTNPVLIFFIVITIILCAPILLNRFRIPSIIGLILAGMLVGPNGFGLLLRDSSFEIFGKVGLLYLMFTAGLDMDINDFKKNRNKGIVFGLLTFLIPMILGILSSYYVLGFSWITSILLASMYASHTLVAYPIVSRYGLTRQPSITITISGTVITVMGALLILAVITGMYKGGIGIWFWLKLIFSIPLYILGILYLFPRITRWFLKKYSDNILQYIFVLAMMFAASYAAELVGLESIIGAFLAGIVLNRYIPKVSPLMNRIDFVGNALFIPYFLIGVGMLIDLKVLFSSPQALFVALVMSIIATVAKWLAAQATRKCFKLSKLDSGMIFGLSNGQAASTLAAVMIGYGIILGVDPEGNPIRLLNEDVLNGTIVMILVTCTISSFVTEIAARKMVIRLKSGKLTNTETKSEQERILVPIANPATVEGLINMAILLKRSDKKSPLYALYVKNSAEGKQSNSYAEQQAFEMAEKVAASVDTPIKIISRYDLNIVSGIVHTISEQEISEVVIGLHHKANLTNSFFGSLAQTLLNDTHKMVIINKCFMPPNTMARMVILVPDKAQYESGFLKWVGSLANIATQLQCRAIFYAYYETITHIKAALQRGKYSIRAEYNTLSEWKDTLELTEVVLQEDLFCIVMARKGSISYAVDLEHLPEFLEEHFSKNNLLVLYPDQFQTIEDEA